jgi:DNA-binding NarL/FixJ family response regulator
MKPETKLYAINEAIWLRDNASKISLDLLALRIQEIAEHDVFSNRQIANICGNILSHTTIGKFVKKDDKSGGRLNPKSLEDIALALFSKARKSIDYEAIRRALDAGTSQGMIAKLTGISQSTISKKFGTE